MNVYKVDNEKLWKKVVKTDGTVVWVEDLNVPNSSREEMEMDIKGLQDWQQEQTSTLPDGVIKGIAEIQEFLEGTDDDKKLTELFSSLQTAITTALAAKLDKTEAQQTYQPKGNYLTEHQDISGKQDVISDLANIRTGAALGSTALQPDDIATLNQKVTALESLISEGSNPTAAIDKFNEIVAFLASITNTETLAGIIAGINNAIAAKYTKPSAGIPKSDFAQTVQASLNKADTALQSHQDISGKLDKTEAQQTYQPKGNYLTEQNISSGVKYVFNKSTGIKKIQGVGVTSASAQIVTQAAS